MNGNTDCCTSKLTSALQRVVRHHGSRHGARGQRASRAQAERFANHGGASEIFFGHRAIRLHYEHHGLAQIGPRLLKSGALGVGAGQLLDKRDEPLWHLSIYRSQFDGQCDLWMREHPNLHGFGRERTGDWSAGGPKDLRAPSHVQSLFEIISGMPNRYSPACN